MLPLLSLLATLLLAANPDGGLALSAYDPYLDAAELYRMQLLGNAFEYPGDKLGVESLGGGALDVPYGLMNNAGDRLVDIDAADPAYWPEELVAELAAAAENERSGVEGAEEDQEEPSMQAAPEEEEESEEDAVAEEAAKEAEEVEKVEESEKAEEQHHQGKTKYSSAQLRDQEHLEHSALHGYQSVSGGTMNGQTKQTKTDKALPAYCNPPNPCPVGKTAAADNCVENFENSADNNQRLLSQQECPCDTEHMFTCPEGSQTVSSKAQASSGSSAGGASSDSAGAADASQQMEINKVIAELSSMDQSGDVMATQKRVTLMAKKSPHFISKRSELPYKRNPYLVGDRIRIAAKKDPNLAKRVMHDWSIMQ